MLCQRVTVVEGARKKPRWGSKIKLKSDLQERGHHVKIKGKNIQGKEKS